MKIPEIKLNDGNKIPQFGLGLWKIKTYEEIKVAFDSAIENGYTLFDSAQVYGNEEFLGRAIKESKIDRSKLFITTKIFISNFGHKKALKSFDESLKNLDMEYIDLILLHFPVTLLRKKTWLALEEIKESGRAKSIGVSNYTIRHLEEMKKYAKIIPAVNQVELHVFLQQPELIKYCLENNIVIEAYSPLAHGKAMYDKTVSEVASKYGKTYTQIMLRFLLEKGLVVIPKSTHPERIKENIEIFDFKLDEEDMKKLSKLDKNLRTCWDPTLVP